MSIYSCRIVRGALIGMSFSEASVYDIGWSEGQSKERARCLEIARRLAIKGTDNVPEDIHFSDIPKQFEKIVKEIEDG